MVTLPNYWPQTGWVRGKDGTSVTLSSIDTSTDANYYLASLSQTSETFKLLKKFIDKSITDRPCTAPARENTRMNRARDKANDNKLGQAIRDAAKRRMKENQTGGPKPPRSVPVTIRDIKVVHNYPLWEMYESFRDHVKSTIPIGTNPFKAITWSIQLKNEGGLSPLRFLPVLDQSAGEALMVHGTSAFVTKIVCATGFRPDMGSNSGTETDPHYGFSGQGTYFSDNFGKTMTYGSCSRCEDFECNCTDESGMLLPRIAILARVVLGVVDKKTKLFSKQNDYRKQSFDMISSGKHSVYTEGWDVSWNAFTFGSGNNEFLAKNTKQMYPEFLVYYVLNQDTADVGFAAHLKDGLTKYKKRFHIKQSSESAAAVKVLDAALLLNDPDYLYALAAWYLGRSQDQPQGAGAALKSDSQLYKDLSAALEAAGWNL